MSSARKSLLAVVAAAEQAVVDAQTHLEKVKNALKWYDGMVASHWKPEHPVELHPGVRVMVRGRFQDTNGTEICSTYISILPGTVANLIDKDADDKWDEGYASTGLIKVEWYGEGGRYIKCWVAPEQVV